MFEVATSRDEYYKLLAQKIYHIRKELEDRKNEKKLGTNKSIDSRCGVGSWSACINLSSSGLPTGNVPSSSSAEGALMGAGATTSGGAEQFINSPHQSLSSSGNTMPISSVENKQDMKQTISQFLSPTSSGFSEAPSSSQKPF